MPQMPTRPTVSPISFPQQLTDRLSQYAEETVASQMDIDVGKLSPEVKSLIHAQVKADLDDRASIVIQNAVDRVMRGVDIQDSGQLALLKQRLVAANEGIQQLTQDRAVVDILDKNARLLRMKYDALVSNGFTAEQAIQLMSAELMGRSARG